MKLLPIVNEIITEGLNLPYKKQVVYHYQTKCYPEGNPHGWHDIWDDEECLWAQALHNDLNKIAEEIPNYFEIEDIRLFDKYQGPYAVVRINGVSYKIWTISDDNLFIQDYPINNTSEDDDLSAPGFIGQTEDDIIDVILHPDHYLPTENN